MTARGQTGNGANHGLFGGAFKALCSRRTKSLGLAFPAPFFGSFFGRAKNEQENYIKIKKVTGVWGNAPYFGRATEEGFSLTSSTKSKNEQENYIKIKKVTMIWGNAP